MRLRKDDTMPQTLAYAAARAGAPLAPTTITRRAPRPDDVTLELLYCGICHSDLHQARDEWGGALFPMVPGHEIIGRVTAVGERVTRFAVGDLAGVGCMVDSCRACAQCRADREQFCEQGCAWTYNSTEMDRRTPTYGGYSTDLVVAERFTLKIPAGLEPAAAAPLLCAGITTWSPLRQWHVKAGDRVAVVGLGGLGHMGVKLAASLGAEVTMLSTSAGKEADARRLGAHAFANTREPATFDKLKGRFDFILDTISAQHDYDAYLRLLRPYGAMALVGVPPEGIPLKAQALIDGNRRLAGSLIGGIAETQEMLDYCAAHGIASDIEIIPVQEVNQAYERLLRSQVRYRFVIDLGTLRS
jgi:uncharacterized zinc-type alcohol dehydrogenase-like protein